MSLISRDISVVVIIRKCHRCRAGPHIYLSDITLGHNSRNAHLTRWAFSDTCPFCGFSCNSCKLTLSLEDILSMLSYSLQYFPCHDYHRKYKHKYLKLQLSLAKNLGVYIFWMSFECIIHSIWADFLPKKRLFLRQYTTPCARTQVENHANASV